MQWGDKSSFDIPVEVQQAFLSSFEEPKNIIDRSYNQYLCQNLFLPKVKVMAFNIIFGLAFPLTLLYYMLKSFFIKEGESVLAVIEDKKMDEVVPIILLQQYRPHPDFWNSGSAIFIDDLMFLFKIVKKAPLSQYFAYKVLMNMAQYSAIIHSHRPKYIIQFGEFSFSRTALTEYCHHFGLKHINVMHGEKLFFIRDSFFQYDECYVWSDYYVNLLCSLQAEPSQFRVSIPPSLIIDCKKYIRPDCYADYKYYLAANDEKSLKRIVEAMAFARSEGKSVRYRPHPRYTDLRILRKYVKESEIELPHDVSIQESIANMNFAVGSYTTVMVQAYFSGKHVIMDDVAEKRQFEKLRKMHYILSEEKFDRLSNHQTG